MLESYSSTKTAIPCFLWQGHWWRRKEISGTVYRSVNMTGSQVSWTVQGVCTTIQNYVKIFRFKREGFINCPLPNKIGTWNYIYGSKKWMTIRICAILCQSFFEMLIALTCDSPWYWINLFQLRGTGKKIRDGSLPAESILPVICGSGRVLIGFKIF